MACNGRMRHGTVGTVMYVFYECDRTPWRITKWHTQRLKQADMGNKQGDLQNFSTQ
jgi:hypothetical protein